MRRYARYFYQPCIPLGEDGRCLTGSKQHIALSRKAAAEGMVLLKNDNKILPLKNGAKVALFGQGSINYIKGGTGSGDVNCAFVRNLYDGVAEKQSEGKLEFFEPLKTLYAEHIKKAFADKSLNKECEISDDLFLQAKNFADIAIISICRNSGEGDDRTATKGDYYLTDNEIALVNRVKAAFDQVVVVLNVGAIIDTNWFVDDSEIGAVLMAWQGGMEGAMAVADILTGDVNPSGKLTDTFAKSFQDYPSSENFDYSDDYLDYNEDIYVGYRYFETIPSAKEKVNFPFGYGLSYTDFTLSNINIVQENTDITVTLDVKNVGEFAGKEVVQVYYSAPQGKLGKPYRELAAFTKTKLLNLQETQKLTLSFSINDMASFDDIGKIQKGAYILEKGDYKVYVGTSVRDTANANFVYTVKEDTITKQLNSYCSPVNLKSRMLADGSFEELPKGEVKRFYPENKEIEASAPGTQLMFYDIEDEAYIDSFIKQFTVDELCGFMSGYGNIGVSNTSSFAGLYRLGIPIMSTADGPAGLRLGDEIGIKTTAWPCATLLACTWNIELMQEVGKAGGLEFKENNLAFWLTPALNIHRNPLCGRNFEYFSEDPVISGEMATAKVKGMQSVGTGCSVKHFACNNKEKNRRGSDSRVSERALREIYIKGFEICVKKANPWSVMTSYNKINGIQTSESYELITGILRNEWGFKGTVITDWGEKNSPVLEVKAGNDMKMPCGYPAELKEAFDKGELSIGDLQNCAKHILTTYLNFK